MLRLEHTESKISAPSANVYEILDRPTDRNTNTWWRYINVSKQNSQNLELKDEFMMTSRTIASLNRQKFSLVRKSRFVFLEFLCSTKAHKAYVPIIYNPMLI